MTKKYDLTGINENVELGKLGSRIINNGGIIEIKNQVETDYVIVRGKYPVDDDDLATKKFVDDEVAGAVAGFSRVAVTTTPYTVSQYNIILGITIVPCTIIIPSALIALTTTPKWTISDETGLVSKANPITITTEGSETINGESSAEIFYKYNSASIYSNGTNLIVY